MTPPRLPRSFALLRRPAIALALALAACQPVAATPHSNVPGARAFQLDFGHRYFDGIELMTVLFASPHLTFRTDTLGAWTPVELADEDPSPAALRHRRLAGLRLDFAVMPARADAETAAFWPDYIAKIQTQLGAGTKVGEVADSAVDATVLRILGGRTREATFTTPASEGDVAECHVHVMRGPTTVIFVLRGTAEAVAAARGDFRFFVSRLDRLTP